MYATGSATTQATILAHANRPALGARQQPVILNAASSISEPTVRSNPQVVAPSLPQNLQPNNPANPELVAYQIQILNFYKAAVVDPLCAFAEQRQQIPDLLRRQLSSQLETMVQEFNSVRQSLNEKLGRTTLATVQLPTLDIKPDMAITEQFKTLGRTADHLSTLHTALVGAQKTGKFTQNPVEKAKAYWSNLEAVNNNISQNLESQAKLARTAKAYQEASQEALKNIRNGVLVAHVNSLPLMECLTSDAPVDPAAFREFKQDYIKLVQETLCKAGSCSTIQEVKKYLEQGFPRLSVSTDEAQLQSLEPSFTQLKRMYDITFKLLELVYKPLSKDQGDQLLKQLQDELTLNTQRSPQLQALFAQHPNRVVKVLARLGAPTGAPPAQEGGATAAGFNANADLAKRYPKITVSPKFVETEIHRESIFKAAEVGSLDTLHLLLAEGVDPYLLNDEGDSLLHIALRKGHIELATFLIQVQGLPADLKGAGDLSVLEQAIQNDEPLVIACLLHAVGQGQMLGENSMPAMLTKTNAQGQTPLQQVVQHNAVRVLEDWTKNFGFKLDNLQVQNQPVLEYVAKNGSQEMLTSVVPLVLPDAPNDTTKEKVLTLALECVVMGKPEAGKYLVKAFGVDVDKPDQDSKTAFLRAAAEGNIANIRALKEMGADMNAIDKNEADAFHLAASFANPETLQVLSREFGFTDFEAKRFGDRTAFLLAASSGNVPNLHALREMGANIQAIDCDSYNAFHLAARFSNPETLRVLNREFGFTALEARGFVGATAFLAAAGEGNLPNLHALRGMGANIHAIDDERNTAFHLAAKFANPETLRVLNSEFGFTALEAKGFKGQTAFLSAAKTSNFLNLHVLKEMGAEIHQRDRNLDSALDLVKRNLVVRYRQTIDSSCYLYSLGVR